MITTNRHTKLVNSILKKGRCFFGTLKDYTSFSPVFTTSNFDAFTTAQAQRKYELKKWVRLVWFPFHWHSLFHC